MPTQYHERHFNLIVNFIRNEEEALDVFRKLTMVSNRYLDISIDYIGSIPLDRQMNEAVRKQKVMVELFPASKASSALEAIAQSIAEDPQNLEAKGSIQFFWKRLLDFGK